MSRGIGLLALLAAVSLAALVLVELQALAAALPGAPGDTASLIDWQSAREPVRVAAAGSLALLGSGLAWRTRRFTRRRRRPQESVIEPHTFSGAAKGTLLVISVLMALFGAAGILGVGIAGLVFAFGPMAAAVALAFLAGGVIASVQLRSSLAGLPSQRMRLPPAWTLALAFALVVSAGEVIRRSQEVVGLSFALFLFLGAALPPLTALAVAAEELGTTPTRRRVLMALVAGGTLSVVAAIVLEILLPGVVALLALPAGELIREIIAIIDEGRFSDLLRSPAAVLLLAELALVAPVVEEAVKPLAVVILGRRIRLRRDALLIGMACGAGFAIIENIGYEGGALHLWAGITVVRGIGAALHPLGAGLTSLGWYGVVHGEPGAWGRLARFYLIAVGAHAAWNGASGIFFILESTTPGVLGPVDLQGVVIDAGLLALFLAEGVVLLWSVRQISRALAEKDTAPPVLQTSRAVAMWGLACLGVLLPVASAGAAAVLRSLSMMLSP